MVGTSHSKKAIVELWLILKCTVPELAIYVGGKQFSVKGQHSLKSEVCMPQGILLFRNGLMLLMHFGPGTKTFGLEEVFVSCNKSIEPLLSTTLPINAGGYN